MRTSEDEEAEGSRAMGLAGEGFAGEWDDGKRAIGRAGGGATICAASDSGRGSHPWINTLARNGSTLRAEAVARSWARSAVRVACRRAVMDWARARWAGGLVEEEGRGEIFLAARVGRGPEERRVEEEEEGVEAEEGGACGRRWERGGVTRWAAACFADEDETIRAC